MYNYLELLENVLDNGNDRGDRTKTGTRSVFGEKMVFTNLDNEFPLMTTKFVPLRLVFHELKWMLNGETNIKYLVDNDVHIWNDWPLKHYNAKMIENNFDGIDRQMTMEQFTHYIKTDPYFAKEWGECGPVYGYQWRKWPDKVKTHDGNPNGLPYYPAGQKFAYSESIDQIQQLLDTLKNNPEDRRMIVSAWNVADLEEMAVSGLPPCHLLVQFYTRELETGERHAYAEHTMGLDIRPSEYEAHGVPKRYLDCQVYIRSNDLFLGAPFNIAQYALMTHLIAHSVGMVPGDLHYVIGDAHIYSNHFEQVQTQMARDPFDSPKLRIKGPPKLPWEYNWEDIELLDYRHHPAIKAPVAV